MVKRMIMTEASILLGRGAKRLGVRKVLVLLTFLNCYVSMHSVSYTALFF